MNKSICLKFKRLSLSYSVYIHSVHLFFLINYYGLEVLVASNDSYVLGVPSEDVFEVISNIFSTMSDEQVALISDIVRKTGIPKGDILNLMNFGHICSRKTFALSPLQEFTLREFYGSMCLADRDGDSSIPSGIDKRAEISLFSDIE